MTRTEPCDECGGVAVYECGWCHGSGGGDEPAQACPSCSGTGSYGPCAACGGAGVVTVDYSQEVDQLLYRTLPPEWIGRGDKQRDLILALVDQFGAPRAVQKQIERLLS